MFCSIFTSVTAQNNKISGLITDYETELPLASAHITIPGTTIATSSNKMGEFELYELEEGQYMLQISYSGYQTLNYSLTIPLSEKINIALRPIIVDLDQIVVTATRSPKLLKESPVLTQVISSTEMENLDLPDIREALERSVPGIEFEMASFGPSLKMMGLPAGYLLIMRDGNRIAGEVNNNIDYERLSMQNISHIEIIRGASSVLYGSNAMAGVVNMITAPQVKPISLDVYTRYASFNDVHSSASLGMKKNDLTNRTTFRTRHTDGYSLSADPDDGSTQEATTARQLSQQFSWTPLKNLELNAEATLFRSNTANTLPGRNDLIKDNFEFSTKAIWYPGKMSTIEAVYHEDQYLIYEKNGYDRNLDYDNLFRNIRLISNNKFFNHSTTTIGTEYIKEKLIAPRNNISEKKNHYDLIAYLQEDAQISKSLSLTGGIRVNYNSGYGTHTTWQFSAMYNTRYLTFRGNSGYGYKTPTFKEKFMDYRVPIGFPIYIHGNPDLNPETSFYKSLSAELTLNNFNLTINAYNNKLDDMITETLISGGEREMIYSYENTEKAKIQGFDIFFYYRIIKTISLTGGYAFNDAKDMERDRQMSGNRKHSAKLNLTYKPGITRINPSIIVQGAYMGHMDRVLYNPNTGKETIFKNLNDFSLWKLILAINPNSYITIQGGVDNVFNYTDKVSFSTFSPGRTAFISASFKL